MTSSRRSSASSMCRSSLALPRKSIQTPSVSIVHAEPEQSSPLMGSAAAELSPRLSLQNIQERGREAEYQNGKGKQRSDSVSESQTPSKRPRTDSINSLPHRISNDPSGERPPASKSWFSFRRTPSTQSLTVPEATQASNTPAHVSTSGSNSISDATKAISDPSTDPPLSESPKDFAEPNTLAKTAETRSPPSAPIPIKSQSECPRQGPSPSPSQGWFGSFSKAQKHTVQNELKQEEPTVDLSMISEVRSNEPSPTSGQQTSSQSIWFTPQTPSRPHLEHIISVPSSPDVKTPMQQDPPPITKSMPEMELVSAHSQDAKLSTLNPSTSRFTLSMPLLGRPKMPLEKALARTESEKTVAPPSTVSISITPPQAESTVPPVTSVAEPTAPDERINSEEKESASSSSSWWHYISLGGKVRASSATLSPSPLPSESPLGNSDGEEATRSPSRLRGSQDDTKDAEGTVQAGNGMGVPEEGAERPISVSSEQTAGSVWYSPWGWYEWYVAPVTPEAPGGFEVPKSEAELIKEEALARCDPPEATASTSAASGPGLSDALESQSPSAVHDPSEFTNPLLASLTGNTKGWVSFFSTSRALTTKSVTEKGEKGDGDMEVMDIDEDQDGTAASPVASMVHPHVTAVGSDGDGKQQESTLKDARELSAKRSATSSLKDSGKGSEKPKEGLGIPLTSSETVKREVANAPLGKRSASPTPSKKSAKSIPSPTPRAPNLVLPTFNDTFGTLPRSMPSPSPRTSSAGSTIRKTLGFVSNVLFAREQAQAESPKGKGRMHRSELNEFGKELPRSWEVLGEPHGTHMLASCKKVVVIGIHGWFPGYAMRTVIGEPTGTSAKFANMMGLAVENFAEKHGIKFEQITKIPLEGEGKIEHRVERLYRNLISDVSWVEALHDADVIFVATHSQGSIVSTHLVSRLILEGHIHTAHSKGDEVISAAANVASGSGGIAGVRLTRAGPQRVCCLALCGIHLGPLAYLQKSSFLMPYIQYFESEAAAELFEFQNTQSRVSQEYVEAVEHVLDHGVKLVYIASLNDQVVPVYSGAFTSVSHPLIMRALYIDGDAYHSSDFLSNLLVLLLRIRNAGLSDGGLLSHLSEATAGSLNGVGHSTAYEDLATFSLAVDYLFLVNDGFGGPHKLISEPFNARDALNDYEIPWALRDLIADERVVYLFSKEFSDLRDAFDDWHPRTTILRDLKRKLEPIRRLKLSSRL